MNNRSATTPGKLYIVATPIGNMEDITARAVQTLRQADYIAAEDTRHSKKLCQLLNISTPLISLHAHNEHDKSLLLIQDLMAGKHIALISDAGTPLISDPGYPLVAKAREMGIEVIPIPGACALIAALSASGLPTQPFYFAGFLDAKTKARTTSLTKLKAIQATIVLYESTHRIVDLVNDIASVYGATYELVIAKELTKSFEHFEKGCPQAIQNWFSADPNRIKGEFVVLLPPVVAHHDKAIDASTQRLLTALMEELPLKQAAKIASQVSGVAKNKLYEFGLTLC